MIVMRCDRFYMLVSVALPPFCIASSLLRHSDEEEVLEAARSRSNTHDRPNKEPKGSLPITGPKRNAVTYTGDNRNRRPRDSTPTSNADTTVGHSNHHGALVSSDVCPASLCLTAGNNHHLSCAAQECSSAVHRTP